MTDLFNQPDFQPGDRILVLYQGFRLGSIFVKWTDKTRARAVVKLDSGLEKTVRREEFREAQCER